MTAVAAAAATTTSASSSTCIFGNLVVTIDFLFCPRPVFAGSLTPTPWNLSAPFVVSYPGQSPAAERFAAHKRLQPFGGRT